MLKSINIFVYGILAGLLFGLIVYFIQPMQWKAQALISLASYKTQTQGQALFEYPSIAMERIKTQSFLLDAAKRSKINGADELLQDSIEVKVTRSRTADEPSALIISINCKTKEQSFDAIDAVVKELIFKHKQLVDLYKSDVDKKIGALNDEIGLATKSISILSKSDPFAKNGKMETESILILALQQNLLLKQTELIKLKDLISDFNLRNTQLLEPIFVKDHRLFSSLLKSLIFGAFMGFLMSLLWVKFKE